MLRGLKSRYEIHHSVSIADSAIVTAAVASNRYISERMLPDKAIDVLDEACSYVRLARESKPDELEAIERQLTSAQIELSSLGEDTDEVSRSRRDVLEGEIAELKEQQTKMEREWREERERGEEIKRAKEELDRRRWQLEEAQRMGKYDEASRLRYETIPELEKKLEKEEGGEDGHAGRDDKGRVTSSDVARVIAKVSAVLIEVCFSADVSIFSGNRHSRLDSLARRPHSSARS